MQNNRDIERYLDQQLINLKEKLAEEREKLDTIQQGKNQAFTIEVEGKILNKVQALIEDNNKFENEFI